MARRVVRRIVGRGPSFATQKKEPAANQRRRAPAAAAAAQDGASAAETFASEAFGGRPGSRFEGTYDTLLYRDKAVALIANHSARFATAAAGTTAADDGADGGDGDGDDASSAAAATATVTTATTVPLFLWCALHGAHADDGDVLDSYLDADNLEKVAALEADGTLRCVASHCVTQRTVMKVAALEADGTHARPTDLRVGVWRSRLGGCVSEG